MSVHVIPFPSFSLVSSGLIPDFLVCIFGWTFLVKLRHDKGVRMKKRTSNILDKAIFLTFDGNVATNKKKSKPGFMFLH